MTTRATEDDITKTGQSPGVQKATKGNPETLPEAERRCKGRWIHYGRIGGGTSALQTGLQLCRDMLASSGRALRGLTSSRIQVSPTIQNEALCKSCLITAIIGRLTKTMQERCILRDGERSGNVYSISCVGQLVRPHFATQNQSLQDSSIIKESRRTLLNERMVSTWMQVNSEAT